VEFQVIAEQLQVTKGRVAQLHARALRLIREGYESLDGFDLEF
jgi:DNA-directed RNA polymerase sigma subunit (sigma70/sigma32)